MASPSYFLRHLSFTDDQNQRQIVDEAQLVATTVPRIVLGEPGMGKSALIGEIGRLLGVSSLSAMRFMHHSNPASCVVSGKPLLIDGLDEAMARREGDAVDLILAKLEEAGSPDFIISCRAREWQSRTVTNLRQIYGVDPTVFTLEPLDRAEAHAFLAERYALTDPDRVLNHLDEHDISELYRSPLTLEMMGKVAEHDAEDLPATRGALFERVCRLLWPEHDPQRQDGGLGKMSEDKALSAAGAVMAGLLLAGAEAASLSGPAQLQGDDVRLAEFESLPGGELVGAIFSSKLFQSIGVGRAKPIHRVIAEFLGARWLAQQSKSARAQRRLLAQLQGSGAVPASLRGLHAWLAFHSSAMAKAVIAADPFGVIRYGDTSSLTTDQADCMFESLQALAVIDPYFRVQDWGSHTATGLMIPNLRPQIEAEIASKTSNAHLRSLLIEGLRDRPLAGELGQTLELIIFSTSHFSRDREGAAQALIPHRHRNWWQRAIACLHDQCTADSILLARSIIEMIDCDVDDKLLVATLLAEIGITICPLPRTQKKRNSTIRHFGILVNTLPIERLTNVLNHLSDHSQLLDTSDWGHGELSELVSLLIVRLIDEEVILTGDAEYLWGWLGLIKNSSTYNRSAGKLLQERLNGCDDLRHAVQEYALYSARPEPTIWQSEHLYLNRRMVGLSDRPMDVVWFLNRLAHSDNKDLTLRGDWCDLMRLGCNHGIFDPDLRTASRKFQRRDAQLEAFVLKLENPKKNAWQRRQEREAAKHARKRRIQNEWDRRLYGEDKKALREGELRAVLHPAQVYLGLSYPPASDLAPTDRIVVWLGTELTSDVMAGFEAVLHRSDIPSPTEISQGFAQSETWNICFALMAGLLARYRSGRGIFDLSVDIKIIGLLLCHHFDRSICIDNDLSALCEDLEQYVIPIEAAQKTFARLWIEPSLVAGSSSVMGLYKLAHDEKWKPTGAILAADWLMKFPNLPEHVELQLVDCLTFSGALTSLELIAESREGTVFRNIDHMFGWLAIDVLLRFDKVLSHLSDIGAQHPEFIWFLRNRFEIERRKSMLPISTANAKWIISQFRTQWPYSVLEGSCSGNTNSHDATDFIRAMINRIANDTSSESEDALQELISQPVDSYSDLIRHMAAEQRQKRAEEGFESLPPKHLADLLTEGAPTNADDLKALVLEELKVAQTILTGDDIDQVRDFWNDAGVPHDENRCRDRLTALIGPELMRYGVQRITEADMPKTKRADLAFSCGRLQLPMEVKGQWHDEVWQAATDQLDLKYLIDWRSEQRGIYCVLWFGNLRSDSGRRLKAPPQGQTSPKSATEMRRILIDLIPEARRTLIDVVVLDLSSGKPQN